MPLFGNAKILHTLIGVGSAALAAAVPYLGKMTQISHKAQWSTLKKKKGFKKCSGLHQTLFTFGDHFLASSKKSTVFWLTLGALLFFFSFSGYYGDELSAMVVFSACYLPSRDRRDYSYVMNHLFQWVASLVYVCVCVCVCVCGYCPWLDSEHCPSQ